MAWATTGSKYPTMSARSILAPAGMFGQPPGLLPDELVDYCQGEIPELRVSTLSGTNHYSILFAPHAAAEIAQLISQADARVSD